MQPSCAFYIQAATCYVPLQMSTYAQGFFCSQNTSLFLNYSSLELDCSPIYLKKDFIVQEHGASGIINVSMSLEVSGNME